MFWPSSTRRDNVFGGAGPFVAMGQANIYAGMPSAPLFPGPLARGLTSQIQLRPPVSCYECPDGSFRSLTAEQASALACVPASDRSCSPGLMGRKATLGQAAPLPGWAAPGIAVWGVVALAVLFDAIG